jgi:putative ABC transport system permease protein
MMMSVFERTVELGILHSIGWRPARIVGLILLESALLSLVGVVLGSIGALILIQVLSGLQGFDTVITGRIPPAVVLQSAVIGLSIGAIGGLYPALRAGSLTPSEALRHV